MLKPRRPGSCEREIREVTEAFHYVQAQRILDNIYATRFRPAVEVLEPGAKAEFFTPFEDKREPRWEQNWQPTSDNCPDFRIGKNLGLDQTVVSSVFQHHTQLC